MKNPLKIIFMGTPDFAVASLDILVSSGHDIVGVITAPDKPAGRNKKIRESAVKIAAKKHGLKVLQPTNLKDPEFIEVLKSLGANLQIVVAFRMLPEIVWDMPSLGTFNLHASLLPQYRGAAPINWAIINGETETGVTTFFINNEIDKGDILFQENVKIDDTENAGQLHDNLMVIGSKLVLRTVQEIKNGTLSSKQQDNTSSELKLAPKIFKDDCMISWEQNSRDVCNFIRGMSPFPGAWSTLSGNVNKPLSIKIFDSEYLKEIHQMPFGTIVSNGKTYLKIACKDGFVSVLNLQSAGKKRLDICDFLRGFKIKEYNKVE